MSAEVVSLADKYLSDYLEVSRCWRGHGHMTVLQGLKKLRPIANQQHHSLLARKAKRLIGEIVSGQREVTSFRKGA